jgi:two-component system sensor histidine kinase RegB
MFLIQRHDASALQRNLARLCLLRVILLAGLLVALSVAEWGLGVPVFSDPVIVAALLGLTLFNGASVWRLQRRTNVSETELFVQLVVDILLMTAVLYRTGGATNPFVSWYLVPLTIAAATLRIGFTMSLAFITLSAYSLLLFYYMPFSPFDGIQETSAVMALPDASHTHHQMMAHATQHAPSTSAGFNLHVFGMWLNFVLSAGLITFFVTRMSHSLREQDKKLAEQHERLLQREQIVSLGALAAGAAHELGTPLSTMTVIARDIEDDLPADSSMREDVVMLRRQLSLCRDILHDLRNQASGEGLPDSLNGLVKVAVERMEVVHPRCRFEVSLFPDDIGITPPSTLLQVIVNLLDNAAQAAVQCVSLSLHEDAAMCCIDIFDDGPGIAPEVEKNLGRPFVTSKEDGMGIGYFLSHASINALGGRIEITTRPGGGGSQTRLLLPWVSLGVNRA